MACGYAKHTGRLGACIATTGPAAIHLLNGLYDATAVRLNLPVKVLILKNNSLAEVRFEQTSLGYRPFGVELGPIDFVAYATPAAPMASAARNPARCGRQSRPCSARPSPRSSKRWWTRRAA